MGGRSRTLVALPSASAMLALTGSLVGCALGPDYASPGSQLAASADFLDTGAPVHSPLPVLKGTTTAAPEAEWWRAFRDPELVRLEARVASQNLDVLTATARLDQSRAQLGTATAAALPTVNGAASAYRVQYSRNGNYLFPFDSGAGNSVGGIDTTNITQSFTRPYENLSVGFDASWELDLWGRVRRSIEAAQAQVDASAEARRDSLVSNLAELARDYVQLRGTQELIRIDRANIKINQDLLDITQTRERRGLVTGVDTATAASQVESIKAQLPQLRQQELQQINAIGLLLAEPPLALSQELITDKAVPPVPPSVPVGIPSDLIARRPDVRRADASLHAAVAQIGVAEAQFFPTVMINGSPTFNAIDPAKVFRGDSLQFTNVGPSLTIPIFDGGKLRSNLVLQTATARAFALAYQKAVLQAWHDVVNALVSLKADEGRRARLARQVADARRSLSLSRSRYTQGVEIFTTVLTNSQTVLQAEMNLAQATAAMSTDLVSLYKALGGGWETTFPDRPVPPLTLADVTIPTAHLVPKVSGP